MEATDESDAGQPGPAGQDANGPRPSGVSMASRSRRGSVAAPTTPAPAPAANGQSEAERQVSKNDSKASAATADSRRKSAGKPSAASGSVSPRETASLISRFDLKMASAGSVASGRRPRSAVSMPVVPPQAGAVTAPPGTASRASLASRGSRGSRSSRGTSGQPDIGLSPGLQQLIARLVNTKDVGLIAYLSAIPGEPHAATRPPAAVTRLQQKGSVRLRSIMKISKPQVRFEPTYRMEPIRPFRGDRARALVQGALETGLAGATYSDQWATDACRILAAYVTQCVKALDTYAPCRYKIATQVSVMERNFQGVRTELGVLWDADRDRYIEASVETSTMVAFAVVYAVYWD